MVLTKISYKIFMNNSTSNKNLELVSLDWNAIQIQMKEKLGVEIYESWLKKINFADEFNNYILLTVPTRFIRDWITSRYLDQILQIVKNYKKDIIRIEFKIAELDKIQKNVHQEPNKKFETKETYSSNYLKDTNLVESDDHPSPLNLDFKYLNAIKNSRLKFIFFF